MKIFYFVLLGFGTGMNKSQEIPVTFVVIFESINPCEFCRYFSWNLVWCLMYAIFNSIEAIIEYYLIID